MFKRLIDSLTGKKEPQPASTKSAPSVDTAKPELITVYDTYGRELKITRSEWREKVLEPNVRSSWNDADKLYSFIVSALNDGFVAEMGDASARLLDIDASVERSHTIRGIVLMKTGDIDAAERIIHAAISEIGETGTLLTNLAKVEVDRGLQQKADETLERAIQLDPNMENGLGWWLTIQKERRGDEAYVAALKQASQIPGSWLPQLWLARRYLEGGEPAPAIVLYKSVLQTGGFNNDALMMISGDLGNNKQIPAIIELVSPVFDPNKHDPRAGFNLLQAYLELKQRKAGEALLGQMYALNMAPYKQHLDRFSAEFQKIAAEEMPSRPIDSEALEVETIALERPVWTYNLREPTWLVSDKDESLPRIALISLAKVVDPSARAEEQREDDVGRMTRAIPLYLAEAIHFWTDFRASTLVPCVKNGGPVVFGGGGNDRALCAQFAANYTHLISGEIDASADQWRVTCRLWDCATQEQLTEATVEADFPGLGAASLKLEAQLLSHIGRGRNEPQDPFYQRPPADAMSPYLGALGQHFMMSLLANGFPKSGLWGERSMLEWPLNMALHWPRLEAAKLMYFSGLAKAAAYGSEILPEFKDRTKEYLKSIRQERAPSSAIGPLVEKLLTLEPAALGESEVSMRSDPEYIDWLERVQSDSSTPPATVH